MTALHRVVSLLGVPSVTLLALVADLIVRRSGLRPLIRERTMLLAFAAVVAAVLYSSELGFVDFGVYRFGFSVAAPLLLAVAAALIAPRSIAVAVTALVALAAYTLRLYGSLNLFDYVVDPLAGIVAIPSLFVIVVKRFRPSRHYSSDARRPRWP